MLRLSHVEDVGLPPGLPGARDMAIEDPEMFGLGLPPGLPGAVSMPTPEDFEMFGLGLPPGLPGARYDLEPTEEFEMFGLGQASSLGEYDVTARGMDFFHESISQAIIGAVGYGIFAKSRSLAIKTAGAVVVGIALSKILANGYRSFVPTGKAKTPKEAGTDWTVNIPLDEQTAKDVKEGRISLHTP